MYHYHKQPPHHSLGTNNQPPQNTWMLWIGPTAKDSGTTLSSESTIVGTQPYDLSTNLRLQCHGDTG